MFAHVARNHICLLKQKIVFALKKEFNSHLLLQYGGLFIVHSSNMALTLLETDGYLSNRVFVYLFVWLCSFVGWLVRCSFVRS